MVLQQRVLARFFNRFGFQCFHAFTACFYRQRHQFIKAWVIITGH
ncbi:hypothetical protein OIU92_02605 [Escherichia coli]|nr:hypothetical protein [Escherichia coli]